MIIELLVNWSYVVVFRDVIWRYGALYEVLDGVKVSELETTKHNITVLGEGNIQD